MLHRTDITSQLQMTMADLMTVCVYHPVLYDKLKKYKANVTNAQTVIYFWDLKTWNCISYIHLSSLQGHQTILTKTVILTRRTQEMVAYCCLNRLVCEWLWCFSLLIHLNGLEPQDRQLRWIWWTRPLSTSMNHVVLQCEPQRPPLASQISASCCRFSSSPCQQLACMDLIIYFNEII